jgi:xanthine dehydrogenase accessory factor
MLELAASLLPVLRAGEPVAVVTVTGVHRSAPRGPGSAMAVLRDGTVIGSISGGCVEGDAVLLATETLLTGRAQSASLGFDDATAHAAGLACGGRVDVIVHRIDPGDEAARTALADAADDRSTRVGIVTTGADAGRILPDAGSARDRDSHMLEAAYGADDVFVVVHEPRPRLVVAGAGEHAIALARVASAAGFTVAVVDVWDRLVTRERFPTADALVVDLPAVHLERLVGDNPASAAVCVLSHDERVDVPALAEALRLRVGFVGAMGARGTVAHRAALLADAGVDAADIARIHSPLGLDLGGSAPEATAVSVLAEIVAARHGGSGLPLRETRGPLHAARAAACTPLLPSPSGVTSA